MGEGAWTGCGEKEEENKQGGVRPVVGLYCRFGLFDRPRWGPPPAASLTG